VTISLAMVIAAMFFMAYLQRGQQREATIRCTMCGSRSGEKHHRDCSWKGRS
jgi:hypothetical protein